jgi:hypothetical protein
MSHHLFCCFKVLSFDPAPVQYLPQVKFSAYRAGPAVLGRNRCAGDDLVTVAGPPHGGPGVCPTSFFFPHESVFLYKGNSDLEYILPSPKDRRTPQCVFGCLATIILVHETGYELPDAITSRPSTPRLISIGSDVGLCFKLGDFNQNHPSHRQAQPAQCVFKLMGCGRNRDRQPTRLMMHTAIRATRSRSI